MAKKAVITGASRGIGRSIAKAFARAGYTVVANYLNNDEAANSLKTELEGFDVSLYKADVSDPKEAFKMAKDITRDFGVPDVLVNNAGIARQRLFCDITPDEYRKMMATNADSVFFVTQAFAKGMINRHSGRIINISSMWGQVGASCEVDYSMSKAAVIGFTKALAKELGPSGITVNCIAPGVILTDMTEHLGKETLDALAQDTPLCKNGTPEDVSSAALFLASDGAAFITGQTICPNGGFVIV